MKSHAVIILLCIFSSCNQAAEPEPEIEISGKERRLPPKITYNYDCIKTDSGSVSGVLDKADDIIGKVATFNIEVTDKEQVAFGEKFLSEATKDRNFIIDSVSPSNDKLNIILNELLKKRRKPTGITYKIYLLEDPDLINAYTVGGKIFITTAMLNKCTNDDQLYAIIGHEIGHNEKGHIKTAIKQMKASKKFFGEWGDLFYTAKKILTGSFNQKNELEADYFGLDLTWMLGYDVCAIRSFWDEMAKGEERDDVLDFLRTHPFSDTRSKCLVKHIRNNFKVECK